MALIFALVLGLVSGCGVFLLLRRRLFSILLGLILISYAVNVLIVLSGRVGDNAAPIAVSDAAMLADPLPQALALTAIVIGFGMTAFLVALMLKSKAETGHDDIDGGA
jgi:multicomponent K+:H+ antiporter subunit C